MTSTWTDWMARADISAEWLTDYSRIRTALGLDWHAFDADPDPVAREARIVRYTERVAQRLPLPLFGEDA